MNISIWYIPTQELIRKWSSKNYEELSESILSSWNRLYCYSNEKKQNLSIIKSDAISISYKEFSSNIAILFISDSTKIPTKLHRSIIRMTMTTLTIFGWKLCISEKDFDYLVEACKELDWACHRLVEFQDNLDLPWGLVFDRMKVAMSSLTPVLNACGNASMHCLSGAYALVMQDTVIMASETFVKSLSDREKLCLSILAMDVANQSVQSLLVRLPSLNESHDESLYRLFSLPLDQGNGDDDADDDDEEAAGRDAGEVRGLVMLVVCANDMTAHTITHRLRLYWTPQLLSDIQDRYTPAVMVYIRLHNALPLWLLAFYVVRGAPSSCVIGHLDSDHPLDSPSPLLLDAEVRQALLSLSTPLASSLSTRYLAKHKATILLLTNQNCAFVCHSGSIPPIETLQTQLPSILSTIASWMDITNT